MLFRSRSKRVELTSAGLKSLRKAMPIAIEVQRKLFGESGQPGGALLRTVRQVHGNMPEETGGAAQFSNLRRQPAHNRQLSEGIGNGKSARQQELEEC